MKKLIFMLCFFLAFNSVGYAKVSSNSESSTLSFDITGNITEPTSIMSTTETLDFNFGVMTTQEGLRSDDILFTINFNSNVAGKTITAQLMDHQWSSSNAFFIGLTDEAGQSENVVAALHYYSNNTLNSNTVGWNSVRYDKAQVIVSNTVVGDNPVNMRIFYRSIYDSTADKTANPITPGTGNGTVTMSIIYP